MFGHKTCVWITALFGLVAYPFSASAVPCLSYLSAERSFQEKAGKRPDHRAIEAALSRLKLSPKLRGDPWQKNIDAADKLKWSRESQDRLYAEDARQKLFGRSVPNISIKSKVASDRVMKALHASKASGEALNKWLASYGIGESAANLIQWFVSAYRENNKVLSSTPPDLVFRVAVHERQTMCPP